MKAFTIDKLNIAIYDDPISMGKAAADFVEKKLKEAIAQNGTANLILATGASQFSFLEAFKGRNIDWQKITVFHLDEYKGISDQHPASFRKYIPGLSKEISNFKIRLFTNKVCISCLPFRSKTEISLISKEVSIIIS